MKKFTFFLRPSYLIVLRISVSTHFLIFARELGDVFVTGFTANVALASTVGGIGLRFSDVKAFYKEAGITASLKRDR